MKFYKKKMKKREDKRNKYIVMKYLKKKMNPWGEFCRSKEF